MKNLVGRCFDLADGRYQIVDIRQMGGDAMVYAELLAAESTAAGPVQTGRKAGTPGRTAFHFADIAAALQLSRSA